MTIYQVSQAAVKQYEASGKTTVQALKGTATFLSVAFSCAMLAASIIPIIYNNSYWWLQFPVAGGIFINAVVIQPLMASAVEKRESPIKAHKKLIRLENESLSTPTRADLPLVDQRFKSDNIDFERKKKNFPQSAKQLQRVVDIYDLAVSSDVLKINAARKLAKQETFSDEIRKIKNDLQKAQNKFLKDVQIVYESYQGDLTKEQVAEKNARMFDIFSEFESSLVSFQEFGWGLSSDLMKTQKGSFVSDEERSFIASKILDDRKVKISLQLTLLNNLQNAQNKLLQDVQDEQNERFFQAFSEFEFNLIKLQELGCLLPNDLMNMLKDLLEGQNAIDKDEITQKVNKLNEREKTQIESLQKLEKQCEDLILKLNQANAAKQIAKIGNQLDEHRIGFISDFETIDNPYNRGLELYGPLKDFSNAPNWELFKEQVTAISLRKEDYDLDLNQDPETLLKSLQDRCLIPRMHFERLKETQFRQECEAWIERHPGVRLDYIRATLDHAIATKDLANQASKLILFDEKISELSDAYYALKKQPNENGYKSLVKQVNDLQRQVNDLQRPNIFSYFWKGMTKKIPEKPVMPFEMDMVYFKDFDSVCFSNICPQQPGFEEFCQERDEVRELLATEDYQAFLQERRAFLEQLGEDPNGTIFEWEADKEKCSRIKAQNQTIQPKLNAFHRQEIYFEKLHRRVLRLIDTEKFFLLRNAIQHHLTMDLLDEWNQIQSIKDPATYRKKVTYFAERLGIKRENLPVISPQFKEEVDSRLSVWQALEKQYDWGKIESLCQLLEKSPFVSLADDAASLIEKSQEWAHIQKRINLNGYNLLVSDFLEKWKVSEAIKNEWLHVQQEPLVKACREKTAAFAEKIKGEMADADLSKTLLVRGCEFYKLFKKIPQHLLQKIENLQKESKKIPPLWAEIQGDFDWDKIILLCQELNLYPLGALREDIETVLASLKNEALQADLRKILEDLTSFYQKGKIVPSELRKQMSQLKKDWEEAQGAKNAADYEKKAQKITSQLKITKPIGIVSEQRRQMVTTQGQLRKIDGSLVTISKISRGVMKGVVVTALLIVECFLSNPWVGFGIVAGLTVLEGVTYLVERHMISLEKKKTALKIEEYVTRYKNPKRTHEAPALLHDNRRTV